MLPEVLAGFSDHAALVNERRRDEEERIVSIIHEQLVQRGSCQPSCPIWRARPEMMQLQDMTIWLRRHTRQMHALLRRRFLDISARAAKVKI
ncbi:MAG: hypothetical protein E5V72_05605 [Mesorhizobium sp.]|nr:MAG: hypothetical protein EOS26_05630 [Mesorhizobium sp.]TIW49832.1 MAG: hypothetical protein E5V72_05605 [Mesorhizobium sp.]